MSSDPQEVLSFAVEVADAGASQLFRSIGNEGAAMSSKIQGGLRGINSEWSGLAGKKPLTLVKAEQAAQIAALESRMVSLNKTVAASGVATKDQAAQVALLSERHKALQGAVDGTTAAHARASKALTAVTAGIVGFGAGSVIESTKAAVGWQDLGKTIEQQTGLGARAVSDLQKTILQAGTNTPYSLQQISDAAVLLKTKFGETSQEIQKQSGLMDAFAQRAGQDVKPALTGLLSVMQDYRQPLSDVVGLTDELTSVAQATQKPLGDMTSSIERFGPKLQAMGFGLQDSIKLLGLFGESGIRVDQMGRGLSAAYTNAQKAIGGQGGPEAALQKQSEALQKAEFRHKDLASTIPKTTAQQTKLRQEQLVANEALDQQRQKYQELKTAIDAAGGAHASISGVVQNEIKQIKDAKSASDAFALSADAFGKMIGPAFARAFYDNGKAADNLTAAIKRTGANEGLLKAQQDTLDGQLQMMHNNVQKLEIEFGTKFVPVLTSVLKATISATEGVAGFVKAHQALVEVVGGAAVGGSALSLLGRKGGPLGAPVRALGDKIGGPIGSFLGSGSGTGGTWGWFGPLKGGSQANPLAVRDVGGGLGGGGAAAGGGAGAAEGEASRLSKVTGALIKGAGIAGGGYVAGQVLGSVVGGSGGHALGSIVSDAGIGAGIGSVAGPVGTIVGGAAGAAIGGISSHTAIHDAVFGKSQAAKDADDINSLTDEVQKLGSGLSSLSPTQMEKIHDEAVKLGDTKFSGISIELDNIAKATGPAVQAMNAADQQFAGSFSAMQKASHMSLSSIMGEAQTTAMGIAQEVGTGSATAKAALSQNFALAAQAVQQHMQDAGKFTAQGLDDINKLMSQALAAYGIKAPKNASASSMSEALGAAQQGVGNIGFGGGGAPVNLPTPGFSYTPGGATGMRVPGGVGPDNWTLVDPSGRPAARVGGAELLIANRHTENAASRATMAAYGKTLGQMVAGETTAHSAPGFATGGFVADSGTNFTVGQEPQIVADLQRMGVAKSWLIHGISGYRSPAHSVAVGGFADDPHTRGEAADIGINADTKSSASALSAGLLAKYGLYRPFYPAQPGEINHVQLLEGVVPAGVLNGGGQLGVAGHVAAALAQGGGPHISTPKWRGPGGTLGAIGQGVLRQVAKAANAHMRGPAGSPLPPSSDTTPGGSLRDWLTIALHDTNHYSAGNLSQLYGRAMQESSGNPKAINLTDSNAKAGHPSKGLLQTIDSTFKSYEMPGHGDIWNPIDNAIAAVRYMYARYGHVVGPSNSGYETGGRLSFAGAFGQGGSVTASTPTLAVFGENGTETAHFLPHAATGAHVTQHNRDVGVGGMSIASIQDTHSAANINISGGVGALTVQTWNKVTAAILKALKDSPDSAFDVKAVDKLAAQAHAHSGNRRLQGLAGQGITAAAKEIDKSAHDVPAGQLTSSLSTEMGQLRNLIAQAKKSGNKALVNGLTKTLAKTASDVVASVTADATANLSAISLRQGTAGLKAQLGVAIANMSRPGDNQLDPNANQGVFEAALGADTGRTSALGREDSQLRTMLKDAKKRHDTALVQSVNSQLAQVDSDLAQSRLDTVSLVQQYQQAIHDAFEKGIQDASTALQSSYGDIGVLSGIQVSNETASGTDLGSLGNAKSLQGGVLTPEQQAQAQKDTDLLNSGLSAQNQNITGGLSAEGVQQLLQDPMQAFSNAAGVAAGAGSGSQLGIDEQGYMSALSTPAEKQQYHDAILQLISTLASNNAAVANNNTALQTLTTATNANTVVMGGSVGFAFNGQNYVAGGSSAGGQSSISGADISVGV